MFAAARILPRLAPVALFVNLLVAAAASPTFGVALVPFTSDGPAVTVTTSVPFATYESNRGPVVFAGRLDVTSLLDFATLPDVGLAATATYTSHDLFQPYFGAGALLGWSGVAEERYAYVTPTLIVGLRVPLNDTWAARVEALAAPLRGRVSFGVGFEVAPW